MFRTLSSISLLVFINSAVMAQAGLPPEFVSCSRIPKNGERLACYDRAVEYLTQPSGRQAAAPTPEASFGLQATVPQPPAAAAKDGASDDEVTSITARITEISSDREGKKRITLDNGQTWRELTKSSYTSLNVGDEVTINRAALGSFMMSIPNGRPIRVRRAK